MEHGQKSQAPAGVG